MKSDEIRKKYLDFFTGRGHVHLPGIPLVPPEDPTLLFTSAGMVPFKDLWAGSGPLAYSRAVTVQKCLRVGGKDSDLENVGADSRHHTFFEMLGNFSFGDYFKEEAISMAWEFVKGELGLPTGRIFASVYGEDEEAREIWGRILPADRIVPLGRRDNFWGPVGETGVCGPCSEIYFDRGPGTGCGAKDCLPGCDCERFLEFWNLVFPQFNRKADGSFEPLARPGIDTGMGLERISAICQGKNSNFETDLFAPLVARLEEIPSRGRVGGDARQRAFRVAADHARALCFMVSEDILPGNEGRSYVARRILRRSVNFLRGAGIEEPSLHLLPPLVARVMGDFYPALRERTRFIVETIRREEERYISLLSESRAVFDRFAARYAAGTVPGDVAFHLYDTHGIPLELIAELAAGDNLTVDEKGFREEMARRRKADSAARSEKQGFDSGALVGLPATIFTGYGGCRAEASVQALLPSRESPETFALVLDRTPFYPERGGQSGDSGVISGDGFEFPVSDTRVDEAGYILHVGSFRRGRAVPGARANALVEPGKRRALAAGHTATHLLHAALREILGPEARQAGSLVSPDHFRLDFAWEGELPADFERSLEDAVNRAIGLDLPVESEERSLEEAVSSGAVALFTEKYAEKVRVVSVDGLSREVCGGTHASRTGELGFFLVTGLSSIGKGVRRVEGVTGEAARRRAREHIGHLVSVAGLLNVKPLEVGAEIERREAESAADRARLAAFLEPYLEKRVLSLAGGATLVGRIKVSVAEEPWLSPGECRRLVDRLREEEPGEAAFLVMLERSGRAQVFLGFTRALAESGCDARETLREIFSRLGGGAGGRADFAQAGARGKLEIDRVRRDLESFLAARQKARPAGGDPE